MSRFCNRIICLGAVVFGIAITGCTDPKESDVVVQPLDHESAHATFESALANQLSVLHERLTFLDGRDVNQIIPVDAILGQADCDLESGFALDDCDDGGSQMRVALRGKETEIVEKIQRVLSRDAIEEETKASVLYRPKAEVICDLAYTNSDDSEPEHRAQRAESVAECEDLVNQLSPRVALSMRGETLSFELLVTEARTSAGTFELSPKRSTIKLNIGAMKTVEQASRAVGQMTGDNRIDAKGTVRVVLDASKPSTAQVTVHIDEPILVKSEGEHPLNIRLGTASPLLAFSVNAAAREIATMLSFGPIVASGSTFSREDETGIILNGQAADATVRRVRLALGGLDIGARVTLGDTVKRSVQVGLGHETSRLFIDDAEVIAVDVNPEGDRLLSVSLDDTRMNRDSVVLAFASRLNGLRISTHFDRIRDFQGPEWLLDETISVTARAVGEAFPRFVFSQDMLRVVEGRLDLSSRNQSYNLSIEAGECLAVEEYSEFSDLEEEEPEHPFEALMTRECR